MVSEKLNIQKWSRLIQIFFKIFHVTLNFVINTINIHPEIVKFTNACWLSQMMYLRQAHM